MTEEQESTKGEKRQGDGQGGRDEGMKEEEKGGVRE